jgi:hypothetical protein
LVSWKRQGKRLSTTRGAATSQDRNSPTAADYTYCRPREPQNFASQHIDEISGKFEEVVAEKLEARGGIEPPIRVLQTLALPLGDRATGKS